MPPAADGLRRPVSWRATALGAAFVLVTFAAPRVEPSGVGGNIVWILSWPVIASAGMASWIVASFLGPLLGTKDALLRVWLVLNVVFAFATGYWLATKLFSREWWKRVRLY